ncbi:recombinase family protein [Polyangium sp. 15x6]|uniref:recombinase family protein n=1 Tax=Polyangium sp. 15x6 TaxID=3042687 RepID=UPI00249C2F88|nr:recombinase family protein [Polyangium sp. 15x6]MDI3291944.1 recombinase family protein [Polyangium sp. 15x6]
MKGETLQSWEEGSKPPERWWAFYIRVTREESVKTDLSIPNQCSRARELASLRRWSDYRIYVEPKHVTAEVWADKRPALKRLLDDIAAGRILGVCARHTDRFWRNNEIQARFLKVLREAGVELWDFNNRYDYKSAHGRFSLQVLGAASELEVNLTGERIREMRRGKAIKGKVGGGPPPFGYTSQSRRIKELVAAGLSEDEAYRKACLEYPIGKCWYIDEKEAATVRLIFELYTSANYRYGNRRICQHLIRHGYRTREGYDFRASTIVRTLNNPVYAGFTAFDEVSYEERIPSRLPRHQQTRYKGEHPALISTETWEKAQQIKTEENASKRTRTKSRQQFALTGIMRCPSCGGRIQGKLSSREKRRYYICTRRAQVGLDVCSLPMIRGDELEQATWNWLHEVLSSPAFVMEHVARLQKKLEGEVPAAQRKLATLKRRRDTVKASIEKYFKVFEGSRDGTPDASILDRVRELRAELRTVEGEIEQIEAQASPAPCKVSAEQVRKYLAKLKARVVEGDGANLRSLFHEFRREHGLDIRPVTNTEFTVALALPVGEMGEGGKTRQVVSALGRRGSRGGPVVSGWGNSGWPPRSAGSSEGAMGSAWIMAWTSFSQRAFAPGPGSIASRTRPYIERSCRIAR